MISKITIDLSQIAFARFCLNVHQHVLPMRHMHMYTSVHTTSGPSHIFSYFTTCNMWSNHIGRRPILKVRSSFIYTRFYVHTLRVGTSKQHLPLVDIRADLPRREFPPLLHSFLVNTSSECVVIYSPFMLQIFYKKLKRFVTVRENLIAY